MKYFDKEALDKLIDQQLKMQGWIESAYLLIRDLAQDVERLEEEVECISSVDIVDLSCRIGEVELGE